MALPILLTLVCCGHVLLRADTTFAVVEDWPPVPRPSFYLEPPSPRLSSSHKTHRSAAGPTPALTASRRQHMRSALGKWFDPRHQWPPAVFGRTADYAYHDLLRCNPCNAVPWIPIITFAPVKIIPSPPPSPLPQPLQLQPPQRLQHSQTGPTPSSFASYYHTFNEMTANLIKPANTLVPSLPFFVGPPVYQQHAQNPVWHSGPVVAENAAAAAAAAAAATPPSSPFLSPDASASYRNQHLNQVAPPVFSVSLHETSRNVGQETAASSEQDGAKPIPILHYAHTVEYPAQFSHAPSTDLSNAYAVTPLPPSPPPPPALPHAIHHLTEFGGAGVFTYADNAADHQLHDISNHLDDTKYSSSENKFSITSNETTKDVRLLRGNTTAAAAPAVAIGQLTDFLTPPAASTMTGYDDDGDGWRRPLNEQTTVVRAKPSPSWTLAGDAANAKPEKRKKQIQIVIPYTATKSKPNGGAVAAKSLKENVTSRANATAAPHLRDVWSPFLASPTSTTVLPIVRYLRENATTKKQQEWTDWQKLRKAIDSWTVERFSNHRYHNASVQADVTTPFSTTSTTTPATATLARIRTDDDHPSRTSYPEHVTVARFDERPPEIQNRVSSGAKNDVAVAGAKASRTKASWNALSTAAASTATTEKVFIVTAIPITKYNFSSNDASSSSGSSSSNANWALLR